MIVTRRLLLAGFAASLALAQSLSIASADDAPAATKDNGTAVSQPAAAITIDDITIFEGGVGGSASAVFAIALSNPAIETVTVTYKLSNQSAGDNDYEPDTDPGVTGIATFDAGTTVATLSVPLTFTAEDDDVDEPHETFLITLSGAAGGNATIRDGVGTGTIISKPAAPAAAAPTEKSVKQAEKTEASKKETPKKDARKQGTRKHEAPEAAPGPAAETASEPTPAAAAKPAPEPTPAPAPEAATAPAPEPAPAPAQEAKAVPEQSPEPVKSAVPAPVVEPPRAPAADAAPTSAPATETTAEPAPAVATEPSPKPAPEPVVETSPEPKAAPTAEQIAEPSVEPAPQPTAGSLPEAKPTVQPVTTPSAEASKQDHGPGPASEAPTETSKAEAPAAASPGAKGEEAAASPPPEQPAKATPPAATEESSVAEAQLKVQGDEKEAENLRQIREQLRQAQEAVQRLQAAESDAPPAQDKVARAADVEPRREDGRARERRLRPIAPPEDEVVQDFGPRFIVRRGDQLMIRQDETSETERLLYRARDVEVEPLQGGHNRTIVRRSDGAQIVTERDRYGRTVSRTRIDRYGREFVLFDNRQAYQDDEPQPVIYFEDELPKLQVKIPRDQYVVETRHANRRAIRAALEAPLVEEAERVYALDEVRGSERLRDKVRRIDLNTITFDSGSAALSPSQFSALRVVGEAMGDVLNDNPNDVFLIEGYTDAVGSDYANLLLSDRRAEAVAVALSSNFDIPPENLITQGYGEQYLKIDTQGPERENRRIAIRGITELVRRDR